MPRYNLEQEYRNATPILGRDYRSGDPLKAGLMDGNLQSGAGGAPSEIMRTYLKDQNVNGKPVRMQAIPTTA